MKNVCSSYRRPSITGWHLKCSDTVSYTHRRYIIYSTLLTVAIHTYCNCTAPEKPVAGVVCPGDTGLAPLDTVKRMENVGGSEQNRSVANFQSDDLWPSRMHAATHILQEKTHACSYVAY